MLASLWLGVLTWLVGIKGSGSRSLPQKLLDPRLTPSMVASMVASLVAIADIGMWAPIRARLDGWGRGDLNPHRIFIPNDFKSRASTDSATPPLAVQARLDILD